MHHEHVPAWLVEFAQLWTCQSATNPRSHEEYQQIKQLANAADVPPFLITLRLFRDTYHIQPDTTWEQFHARINTQISADDGQMLLHLDMLPPEELQRAASASELQDTAVRAIDAMEQGVTRQRETRAGGVLVEGTSSLHLLTLYIPAPTPKPETLPPLSKKVDLAPFYLA